MMTLKKTAGAGGVTTRAPAGKVPLLSKRLSVVDRNEWFLRFVSDVAQDQGYQVETYADPKDLLRDFDRFRPQVLLFDVVMPGIDGIELVRWLGAQDPAVSVIVCTSSSPILSRAVVSLAETLGLREVRLLGRPVSREVLRDTLSSVRPAGRR